MMRTFFKIISGMGFISALLGMGAMDSDLTALPITMIFAGLAVFCFGMHQMDKYA
jgi:hypothetical protein